MFILLLTYTKPLEEVDALMRDHMAWLNEQYQAGRFLVSGRQVPRTGGVIVARGDDREGIEALAAGDLRGHPVPGVAERARSPAAAVTYPAGGCAGGGCCAAGTGAETSVAE
jgi:uncharacterized protein YciI